MRIIEHFDSKNYDMCHKYYKRIAVRAIIFKDQKLALISSSKFNEFKFPGGGKENDETDIDTVIRETKEETGLIIIKESISFYGKSIEKRRSIFDENEIFEMDSHYYLCDIYDEITSTKLDDYEHEYGYQLKFVSIDEAIYGNIEAAKKHHEIATWIQRELAVLYDLKKQFNL
ncbi:MAG: NUDIX domain-containing protein [Acholeplasmataceae bacterium]|nr:NUDIX domain-containing protein [Acholeplasmataceae bacterium]